MSGRDGGPAFPVERGTMRGGMSLRDWFAGQALAGMFAMDTTMAVVNKRGDFYDGAVFAYRIADAMLAAREPQP